MSFWKKLFGPKPAPEVDVADEKAEKKPASLTVAATPRPCPAEPRGATSPQTKLPVTRSTSLHDAARAGDLENVGVLLGQNPQSLFENDGQGATPLHCAAHNGHTAVVGLLLASQAAVDAKDNKGDTPLHTAVSTDRTDIVQLLLARNAQVDVKNNIGQTPLLRAAWMGHKAALESLLSGQADVNAKGKDGEGPLHMAAVRGHRDVVEALLANGADVSAKDSSGKTPLHWATHAGSQAFSKAIRIDGRWGWDEVRKLAEATAGLQKDQKAVAEVLLANSAEVDAKANDGRTPLHWAAQDGNTELARVLLASNADVNARDDGGKTPLHLTASATGREEEMKFFRAYGAGANDAIAGLGRDQKAVAEILLANQAEVNATDAAGRTPLDCAVLVGHKTVVELLLQHGGHPASPDVPLAEAIPPTAPHTHPAGATSRSVRFFDAVQQGDVEKVKRLLAENPDLVFSKDKDGYTALHWSVGGDHAAVVEVLLTNKAEYSVHDAAAYGDLEKVKELLKSHPEHVFSKNTHGFTPLHSAAVKGRKDVAELLVASGAAVGAKDNLGCTPLTQAVVGGHKDVAASLLANGAEANTTDNKGLTPLHWVATLCRWKCLIDLKDAAELLLASGADIDARDSDGKTPLHHATDHILTGLSTKDIAKWLLAHKADVNARDNEGNTPLHLAAFWGHMDEAAVLLANRAEVDAKNNRGTTPLDLAATEGHGDVAESLRQHAAGISQPSPVPTSLQERTEGNISTKPPN